MSLGIEHYATAWSSAREAAVALLGRRDELVKRKNRRLRERALADIEPPPTCHRVGGQHPFRAPHADLLKRLEDEKLLGVGRLLGNVRLLRGHLFPHVWNYALSHAYLFPAIQRSFLDTAFAHGFRCGPQGSDGAMNFRIPLPLGVELPLWHAASDGQLGQIVQIYRDWRLTGDDGWLRSIYPAAKRAMGYALKYWDRDLDGLVETDMHNTYDINFCTPNPLTQFFYLAALRATHLMAGHIGDDSMSSRCQDLLSEGAAKTGSLWNGEFFRQLDNFEACSGVPTLSAWSGLPVGSSSSSANSAPPSPVWAISSKSIGSAPRSRRSIVTIFGPRSVSMRTCNAFTPWATSRG